MEIGSRGVWQQAAGDTNRDYSELCLRWGVILNGPGEAGEWPGCESRLREQGWSSKKLSDLRRFADEMQDGELVVLRIGTGTVCGVGVIVGPYEWSNAFGDVDGWDLQHVRRVRWLWRRHEAPRVFDTYAMKLGDTTQRLDSPMVTQWLEELQIPAEAWEHPLPALPPAPVEVKAEEVAEFLFDRGVAAASITSLLGQIGELTRIAKWYQRAGRPSEHETVAYLVVPLLRVLGWTPQRMAIEWNRVDVALFHQLPRSDATLRVVVEAKRMDRSCLTALSQAEAYAKGKEQCHRLIVTDGMRYGVYVRSGGDAFELYAYLNLARLRDAAPAYFCHGAREALLAMTPEWVLTPTRA